MGLTPDKKTWLSKAALEQSATTGLDAIRAYYGPNVLKEILGFGQTVGVCIDEAALQEIQKYFKLTFYYAAA